MPSHQDDDSDDTDWDSIYDEQPAESEAGQAQPSDISSAKGREAATERRMGTAPRGTSSQSQQASQPTPSWVDDSTPLLDAGPPPPSYSDVTAQRSLHSSQSMQPISYGAVSHEPQNMTGTRHVDGGESGGSDLDGHVKKRHRRWRRRKILKKIAMIFLTFALLVTLTMTTWRHDTSSDKKGNQDGGHKDDDNDSPLPPQQPGNGSWWSSPRLQHCNFEYYSLNHFYEFASLESFSFIELMENQELRIGDVDGIIRISPASANQKAAIVVVISISTTMDYAITRVNVEETSSGLTLKSPTLERTGRGSGGSCMIMTATILIRADVDIEDFEIASEHFNIRVDEDLFNNGRHLKIRNSTELTTISGDVNIAYWSSRRTVIDVISGSVTGTYALNDLLSIQTRSGSIMVEVAPKAEDKKSPAPAEFVAKSVSGAIGVNFPIKGSSEHIPPRDYRTHTETNSGSIHGSYILGRTSTIQTVNGAITAEILPYASEDWASNLRTESRTGHTALTLLSPFLNHGHAMRRFHSIHTGNSGGFTLNYPQEWEGMVNGGTKSGSLMIRGKDVEVIRLIEGPGIGKHLRAKKGDSPESGSTLDFSTISGSVQLTIGDTA